MNFNELNNADEDKYKSKILTKIYLINNYWLFIIICYNKQPKKVGGNMPEEVILKIASIIEIIARENPESLDAIVTDQVLIWLIQKLEKRMMTSLDRYMEIMNGLDQENLDDKARELCEKSLRYNLDFQLQNYELYKVYTALRESRGLENNSEVDKGILDFITDLVENYKKTLEENATLKP